MERPRTGKVRLPDHTDRCGIIQATSSRSVSYWRRTSSRAAAARTRKRSSAGARCTSDRREHQWSSLHFHLPQNPISASCRSGHGEWYRSRDTGATTLESKMSTCALTVRDIDQNSRSSVRRPWNGNEQSSCVVQGLLPVAGMDGHCHLFGSPRRSQASARRSGHGAGGEVTRPGGTAESSRGGRRRRSGLLGIAAKRYHLVAAVLDHRRWWVRRL